MTGTGDDRELSAPLRALLDQPRISIRGSRRGRGRGRRAGRRARPGLSGARRSRGDPVRDRRRPGHPRSQSGAPPEPAQTLASGSATRSPTPPTTCRPAPRCSPRRCAAAPASTCRPFGPDATARALGGRGLARARRPAARPGLRPDLDTTALPRTRCARADREPRPADVRRGPGPVRRSGDFAAGRPPSADSLALLPVVGRCASSDAAARQLDPLPPRGAPDRVDGEAFVATVAIRHPVERYNEQLSLLCNAEGGRLLCDAVGTLPLARSRRSTWSTPRRPRAAGRARAPDRRGGRAAPASNPRAWPGAPTHAAGGLGRSPADLRPDRPVARVARALQRQAVMVNVRSVFTTSRAALRCRRRALRAFSAPMREIVGVFVHKEAVELLGMAPRRPAARRRRAARPGAGQRQPGARAPAPPQRLTNRRVIDHLFEADLARPARRPASHVGTSWASRLEIHVGLDAPPSTSSSTSPTPAARWAAVVEPSPGGAALLDPIGAAVLAVGDRSCGDGVEPLFRARDRWVLAPVRRPRGT